MGTVGDALDNEMTESFFATLRLELLDRRKWETRTELAQAIFEYIEAFYNQQKRHTSIENVSPIEYEHCRTALRPQWHDRRTKIVRETGGRSGRFI